MNGKKVLIVDDDPDVREFVATVFDEAGWQTLELNDGDEVIDVAGHHAPDAIVLDIRMPTLNGFEVFQALRTNPATGAIPVIVVTSVNDFELGSEHNAATMGNRFNVTPPEVFLAKPIDRTDLRNAMLTLGL
ncbi:MAG: hypothetical protein AMXMBFR84_23530 [Candidatus Hydrogenedentota bacterium]